MSAEEQELIRELATSGYSVGSISELFERKFNYKRAVPILLKWLPRIADQSIKEEIVRALSVKWAKPIAGPVLVREFEKIHDPAGIGIRWAIASALAVVADDSIFDALRKLVKNRDYGKSREMLAIALGNMKDARTDDLLIDLLGDEVVAGHVLTAVRKRRTQKARPKVEALANHPKAWVRKEAKRTLEKLSRG